MTISNDIIGFVEDNKVAIAIGTAGVAAGAILGTAAIVSANKSKSRKRKASKRKTVRSRVHRNSRSKRKRYTPHTAGKRKDRSHKRIRQTKTGQPYIILANGRARFISKRSARLSRKRKGGRY